MRILLVSILLCFSVWAGAQIDEKSTAEEVHAFLTKEFAGVDKTKLTQLVPFKQNDVWGFMYADTKKVAVKPCFTFINFFTPNFIGFCYQWEVEIYADPFSIDVHEQRVYCNEACVASIEKVFVISSKTDFKGFSVDDGGSLESYADIYYIDENRRDISAPFEYKYEYFAIVLRNDSCGIIDMFGEPLKGFDFNYKRIALNGFASSISKAWFYVESFAGDRYFVSTNGEKRFENNTLQIPMFSNIPFGLSVVNDDAVSGVFDLKRMDWFIAPQSNYHIDVVYYSAPNEVDFLDPLTREQVDLYFLVRNKNREFFVDKHLNPLLPKR